MNTGLKYKRVIGTNDAGSLWLGQFIAYNIGGEAIVSASHVDIGRGWEPLTRAELRIFQADQIFDAAELASADGAEASGAGLLE